MTTDASTATARTQPTRGSLSVRNLVLAAFGALLAVAALRGLLWYSVEDGNNVAGDGFTFADLHANADSLSAPVAGAYFDWLAWTLLIATVVLVLMANIPNPLSQVARVLAFVVGASGLIATYYAVAQLFNAQRVAGGSEHSVWHNSSLGLWAALAGFACLTLAGGLGSRRST